MRVGILGSGLMGGKLGTIFARAGDVLRQASELSGKVIVRCSLPMNADDTDLVVAHTSSGAEKLAKKVPKARVVSAFGTVPSEVLFDVYEAKRKTGRPSLVYCGDDKKAKALLIARLAYEGKGGPALAYRFERF